MGILFPRISQLSAYQEGVSGVWQGCHDLATVCYRSETFWLPPKQGAALLEGEQLQGAAVREVDFATVLHLDGHV